VAAALACVRANNQLPFRSLQGFFSFKGSTAYGKPPRVINPRHRPSASQPKSKGKETNILSFETSGGCEREVDPFSSFWKKWLEKTVLGTKSSAPPVPSGSERAKTEREANCGGERGATRRGEKGKGAYALNKLQYIFPI
jgi:hypothetical protein